MKRSISFSQSRISLFSNEEDLVFDDCREKNIHPTSLEREHSRLSNENQQTKIKISFFPEMKRI